MAASTLQVLAGILRPGLDSNFRQVFNIGHWMLGKLTHITAGIDSVLDINIYTSVKHEIKIKTSI